MSGPTSLYWLRRWIELVWAPLSSARTPSRPGSSRLFRDSQKTQIIKPEGSSKFRWDHRHNWSLTTATPSAQHKSRSNLIVKSEIWYYQSNQAVETDSKKPHQNRKMKYRGFQVAGVRLERFNFRQLISNLLPLSKKTMTVILSLQIAWYKERMAPHGERKRSNFEPGHRKRKDWRKTILLLNGQTVVSTTLVIMRLVAQWSAGSPSLKTITRAAMISLNHFAIQALQWICF